MTDKHIMALWLYGFMALWLYAKLNNLVTPKKDLIIQDETLYNRYGYVY
jgi:hypothetical protein